MISCFLLHCQLVKRLNHLTFASLTPLARCDCAWHRQRWEAEMAGPVGVARVWSLGGLLLLGLCLCAWPAQGEWSRVVRLRLAAWPLGTLSILSAGEGYGLMVKADGRTTIGYGHAPYQSPQAHERLPALFAFSYHYCFSTQHTCPHLTPQSSRGQPPLPPPG